MRTSQGAIRRWLGWWPPRRQTTCHDDLWILSCTSREFSDGMPLRNHPTRDDPQRFYDQWLLHAETGEDLPLRAFLRTRDWQASPTFTSRSPNDPHVARAQHRTLDPASRCSVEHVPIGLTPSASS